jgi:hypothetical protein
VCLNNKKCMCEFQKANQMLVQYNELHLKLLYSILLCSPNQSMVSIVAVCGLQNTRHFIVSFFVFMRLCVVFVFHVA